jgi:predicted DNA-binding transcriptional regulator AlpA
MPDTATQEKARNTANKRRGSSRIPLAQQAPYPGGDQLAAPSVPGTNQLDISANLIRGPPRLWDCATTCAFFGGIDVSTLYRGMNAGRYPHPVLVSANVARWLADECEAALQRMIAARDDPSKQATRRGRAR